jgi:hypothetical protein
MHWCMLFVPVAPLKDIHKSFFLFSISVNFYWKIRAKDILYMDSFIRHTAVWENHINFQKMNAGYVIWMSKKTLPAWNPCWMPYVRNVIQTTDNGFRIQSIFSRFFIALWYAAWVGNAEFYYMSQCIFKSKVYACWKQLEEQVVSGMSQYKALIVIWLN